MAIKVTQLIKGLKCLELTFLCMYFLMFTVYENKMCPKKHVLYQCIKALDSFKNSLVTSSLDVLGDTNFPDVRRSSSKH